MKTTSDQIPRLQEFFDKTLAPQLMDRLLIAERLLSLIGDFSEELPTRTQDNEIRKAITTILVLAYQSLVSACTLCSHGLGDQARSHSRKLFELYVSAKYIGLQPDALAKLYNKNDILNLIITTWRRTHPSSPSYTPNLPDFEAKRDWSRQAFGEFKRQFTEAGVPFPQSLEKMGSSISRSWSGKSLFSMVEEIAEKSSNVDLAEALFRSYDESYRTDCQFEHLTGIGRRSAFRVVDNAITYNLGPREKGVEEALYCACSNAYRVLCGTLELAECANEESLCQQLSPLEDELVRWVKARNK